MPGVKILFISGACAEAELKDRIEQYDATFLAKPFPPPRLLSVIDHMLNTSARTVRIRRAPETAAFRLRPAFPGGFSLAALIARNDRARSARQQTYRQLCAGAGRARDLYAQSLHVWKAIASAHP
jgi:hypothetical protein